MRKTADVEWLGALDKDSVVFSADKIVAVYVGENQLQVMVYKESGSAVVDRAMNLGKTDKTLAQVASLLNQQGGVGSVRAINA